MANHTPPEKPSADEELARQNRLRVKNRRKRYLETHPEYFNQELELADPLLYDRLIRQYQTSAEREAEGRAKGSSGLIEAEYFRAYAKVEAVEHPNRLAMFEYKRDPVGRIVTDEGSGKLEGEKMDKEEALNIWKWEMEMRFVQGQDDEFDYGSVDYNDEYDGGEQERDRVEKYFEEVEVLTEREDGTPLQGQTGEQDF